MDSTSRDSGAGLTGVAGVAGVIVARERIAVAAGAALLVAGLILVIAVLPAEYGVDPLGIGRLLGLTAMSDVGRSVDALAADRAAAGGAAAPITPQDRRFQQETVEFQLAPGEYVEYKYRLGKGEALLFTWNATGPVNLDVHAEPDGAPRGYAESYEKKDRVTQGSGTMTAPFSGIHGWYWQNQTRAALTVTLSTAGFYKLSHEFREGQPAKNKTF
jgi:hypothetical protein